MYTVTSYDGCKGFVYDAFAHLYERLSVKPLPPVLGCSAALWGTDALPKGLGPYLRRLYAAAGYPAPQVYTVDDAPQPEAVHGGNRALVAFSGGKDSLAAALKLRAAGADVTLFHVRGINRAYPHELDYSRAVAARLQLPLVESTITVKGAGDYVENPVKNHLLLAMMVEHGRVFGFTTFAFGCDDHLGTTVNPDYNMSDALELFDELAPFYQQFMPAYRCLNPIANGTDAYWTIAQQRKDLLADFAFASCMMPYYRKARIRAANLAKGVQLEASRCGSCKKCAYEYVHATLLGARDFDAAYFARCIESLRKHAESNDPSATKFTAAQAVAKYVDVPFLRAQGVDTSRLPQ